jgi:hypothetical protein
MAFTLMEFWPCLSRETLFFQELAFVIHQGETDVASMLQTNNTKLRSMKGLIKEFDMEVSDDNKVAILYIHSTNPTSTQTSPTTPSPSQPKSTNHLVICSRSSHRTHFNCCN